jgi:Signal transduction histidine kinase
MEAVNCKELCQEVIASFQPTNPLLVKVTTDIQVADDLTIRSSKERVRDILIEMLDNANKFTHQGSITLACYQGNDGTINFSVSDTGIGIAECDRERIFTQFTKVSYFTEGVGLGLSMSKQTAQRLGGDLLIDTSYQGGSRFVLTLKTT